MYFEISYCSNYYSKILLLFNEIKKNDFFLFKENDNEKNNKLYNSIFFVYTKTKLNKRFIVYIQCIELLNNIQMMLNF